MRRCWDALFELRSIRYELDQLRLELLGVNASLYERLQWLIWRLDNVISEIEEECVGG